MYFSRSVQASLPNVRCQSSKNLASVSFFPEWLRVDRVHFHPALLERDQEIRVDFGHVGAAVACRLFDVPRDERLDFVGERLPAPSVHEEPVAVPHMTRQRQMVLDFVELARLDHGEGIFLPVDDLGLERGVHFGEIQADGSGAERAEQRSPCRADGDADLEAEQILGRLDPPRTGGDLAEAGIPDRISDREPALLDLRADMRAEISVHGGPDRLVVLPREGDAVNRGDRHQGGEDERGNSGEIDRAGADLCQHVGVRTELAQRKHLEGDFAVGFSADPVGGLAHPDRVRIGVVLSVTVFERERFGERLPGLDDGGSSNQRCCRRLEKTSSAYRGVHFLFSERC